MRIRRPQVVARLREAGWHYQDATKRVELYRRTGSTDRIVVPKRDSFEESLVRLVLRQGGLTPQQIEQFLRQAVKD